MTFFTNSQTSGMTCNKESDSIFDVWRLKACMPTFHSHSTFALADKSSLWYLQEVQTWKPSPQVWILTWAPLPDHSKSQTSIFPLSPAIFRSAWEFALCPSEATLNMWVIDLSRPSQTSCGVISLDIQSKFGM